jgi:hypothetical protein
MGIIEMLDHVYAVLPLFDSTLNSFGHYGHF